MVQWNPDLLNHAIAPGVTDFTEADIPDLRARLPEGPFLLSNHFLNSCLRGRFDGWIRQYALNFIYRAEMLFRAYCDARDHTLKYLAHNEPLNPSVSTYYLSVAKWENALLHWAGCFHTISKNSPEKIYQRGEGTLEERMGILWGRTKHHVDQMHQTPLSDNLTIPVWLSNEGLHTTKAMVTFVEFASTVENMVHLAEHIVDPRTAREKVLAEESPKRPETD